MIISYEMFLRSVEEVRNIKFGLVICDEAHRLKNTAIKTATVSACHFVGVSSFPDSSVENGSHKMAYNLICYSHTFK